MPSQPAVAELKQRLEKVRGRFLLWESAPDSAVLAAMQDLGLRSLVFSPCEQAPAPGAPDYLAQMRASIASLAAAFE